jgi:hypothetical protein
VVGWEAYVSPNPKAWGRHLITNKYVVTAFGFGKRGKKKKGKTWPTFGKIIFQIKSKRFF